MSNKKNLIENVEYIIVHCSDNIYEIKSALDIHLLHVNFGWEGIGYHKVIRRDGLVENGRPEYWAGAHVKGLNHNSLGICLIGKDKFTIKQFFTLEKELRKWRLTYPKAEILGHCDTENTTKTCPNFDVKNWIKSKKI